jgi:hypothetical protein
MFDTNQPIFGLPTIKQRKLPIDATLKPRAGLDERMAVTGIRHDDVKSL